MPVLISACFVLVVPLHVSEGCVLIRPVCTAYLDCTFHIMSYVMSDMLPCSCLIVEPDLGHTSVGSGCVLQCICLYKSVRFWTCQHRPRHYRVRPIEMRPFWATQVTGGFSTQTEDSSTFRQPSGAASARRSRACLPCACLWTSTCLCLVALFRRARHTF